jgi:hypothetical protein
MKGSRIEAIRPELQSTGLPSAAALPQKPRCAAIIAANPASQVAGLEAAATSLAEAGAASVQVGNPLSSSLTLRRILFQIDLDGDEDDTDADDEAHLVRLLKERRGARDRLVLVIERAETLDPAALFALQRIASAPGAVHILFVGGSAFWTLLDDAELAPLRRVLTRQGTELSAVTPPAPATASQAAPDRPQTGTIADCLIDPVATPQLTMPARSGRRWLIVGAVGLVAVALGTAAMLAPGGLFYYAAPQRDMPTLSGEATGPQQPPVASWPASAMPAVVAAPSTASPPVATPTLPSTAQTGSPVPQAPQVHPKLESTPFPEVTAQDAAVMTDAQRDAKTEQSSPSLSDHDAAASATPSSSEGRIVIHYRGGSTAGEAEAERLAGAAAPLAARVQIRVVADAPSQPVIRFFYPEDEAPAHRLADVLRRPSPGWDVKDFGSFRPRPSLGTIEVWTPTR